MDYLTYKADNPWYNYFSADLAHHEIFHAKDGKDGIKLNIGLSLNLHPYCDYVSSDGSDESARLRRLV